MKKIKSIIEGYIDLVFGVILGIIFTFLLFGGDMKVSSLLIIGSKENLVAVLFIFNIFLFFKHFRKNAKYEIASFLILMFLNYIVFVNQKLLNNIVDMQNIYWQSVFAFIIFIILWDIATQGDDGDN
jgi:hypothetical protein